MVESVEGNEAITAPQNPFYSDQNVKNNGFSDVVSGTSSLDEAKGKGIETFRKILTDDDLRVFLK